MKYKKAQKLICLVLCAAAVLSLFAGCNLLRKDEEPAEDKPENSPGTHITGGNYTPEKIGDSVFTLNFDPAINFTPITGTNANNMLAAGLMFEPLFAVSSSFEAIPVLCTDYTTEDGKTWDFKILEGITFHDGAPLTSADVAFTYTFAKRVGKYTERLDCITSVTTPDTSTVRMVLSKPNYDFPLLLDVPIIKGGTIDDSVPPGTGPYSYNPISDTRATLTAYTGYRNYENLSLKTVMLKKIEPTDINRSFASSELDLICYDPSAENSSTIQADHELVYYPTTVFDYIGFNNDSISGSNKDIRFALSYAIDREAIVDTYFSEAAVPAYSVFSPDFKYYTGDMDENGRYSVETMSSVLRTMGADDVDGDSYLEYPYNEFGYAELTIKFIVNEESDARVNAAQHIAYALRNIGINITLEVLPWNEYIAALEDGSFDMYYGEVKLQNDFDLSELLLPGGALNYGDIPGSQYTELMDAYLAAEGDARKEAASSLATKISLDAYILPILYKENVVAVHRNCVKGIDANQSSLFYNFSDWTIDLEK